MGRSLFTSPPELKVVNKLADTFLVNYKFADERGQLNGATLPAHIVELLDVWQQEAREEHDAVLTELVFSYVVGDVEYRQPLLMRPYGSGIWPWMLYCDDVKVYFAPGTLNAGLFCQVRFSSHLLHTLGPERAVVDLEAMLYDFLALPMHEQCSEIHISLDLQGFDFSHLSLIGEQLPFVSRVTNIRDRPLPPLEEEQEGGLSSQQVRELEKTIEQEKQAMAEQGGGEYFHLASVSTTHRRVATIDFGSHASEISAQIYNKTLEVKTHHKEWMPDIWRANGWDGESDVWRLEYRLKRPFLRHFELDGAFDVLRMLPALWRYCTEQWLRFVEVDAAHGVNVSRLPTHPVWELIQRAYDELSAELQAGAGDQTGEREMRIKHLVQEKPLQTIEQATAIARYEELEATSWQDDQFISSDDLALLHATAWQGPLTFWRAALLVVFSYMLIRKRVQTAAMEEWQAIDITLRDEPIEVQREIAQETVGRLSPEQVTQLLAGMSPGSFEVVRTELVKRSRRLARLKVCIAGALGYLRSAVAVMPPGEMPGVLGINIPDLFSSLLWFHSKAKEYDCIKGREHIEEVHKKQLHAGFVTALRREQERVLGVAWPKFEDHRSEDIWAALLSDERQESA